ncbi:hypothetical protein L596_006916 [Steinernema carpocapsae]|uniref:Uncharacterized protein n=1 Tax=Steinernema carpocapsae TaxID=34508 RepID=A0A4U5P8D5_STECR|nr:hypothetical protein L596_006916 [Steinernema carpocapsae]
MLKRLRLEFSSAFLFEDSLGCKADRDRVASEERLLLHGAWSGQFRGLINNFESFLISCNPFLPFGPKDHRQRDPVNSSYSPKHKFLRAILTHNPKKSTSLNYPDSG